MGQIISGSRRIDGDELGRRVRRAAAGYASLGLGVGDAVAVLMRNDIAFFEASLGANLRGADAVPINWHASVDEAAYILGDCGAKVLVTHADLAGLARAALPSNVKLLVAATPPEIREAYNLADATIPPDAEGWDAWRDSFPDAAAAPPPIPAMIFYTSGTTGRPKGVRRLPTGPQETELATSVLMREMGFRLFEDPNLIRTAVVGPMYHTAPNVYGFAAVVVGANIWLHPKFDPEGLLRSIEAERLTHLHLVPIMFKRLLDLPREVRKKYDLSSLRHVVHAAAPCPPDIKRAMIEWWGPIINEYYGCTETGMVVSCSSQQWLEHPGTVGRPLPEAIVRILDANGRDLPPGEVGEIAARLVGSPDFTYSGDPAKRSESDRGGLIAPGDVGYLDADGYLFLTDRSKDMIISGGVNIYPAEIEAAILSMNGIVDCAVFGIPDAEFGEAVHAVIKTHLPGSPSENEIRAHLAGKLARFKLPRSYEFVAELPREDSGKIFKRKLRDRFWADTGRRI